MTLPSPLPIVQAPMAGGPSTTALTVAVLDAGGFGFVAGGYLSLDALRSAVADVRSRSEAAFGVNLFVPSAPGDPVEVAAYAATLQAEADRLDVTLGDPRWEDDAFAAKVELLAELGVHTVSFTFGCPTAEQNERLHGAGVVTAITVTTAAEALAATELGADLLAVQGTEAGGHQGSFLDRSANHTALAQALTEVRDASPLPMIAAGGIMSAADATAAHELGAVAVQIGTALLCTPEAGTSAVHRAALLEQRFPDTIITRAYSGRYARGLANRFAREHDGQAPAAYPEVHHLTRPLRTAAATAGDDDVPSLWAGTGWRGVRAEPAAVVVRRIAGVSG
jgi:nitronate monooxygenase